MKIFSRKKYIEVEGFDDYYTHKAWVDLCNDKEVINGIIKIGNKLFAISDIWCIDKPNRKFYNKPLSIKFNKLYKITVLFDDEQYHLLENGRAFMKDLEFKMGENIITEFRIDRNYIYLELIDDNGSKHTVKYIIKEYKEKTHN